MDKTIINTKYNNTLTITTANTNLSSNNETIINKQIKKRGRPSHNRINQNEPKVKKLKNTHLIQNDNNLVLKEIEIKKLTNELNPNCCCFLAIEPTIDLSLFKLIF